MFGFYEAVDMIWKNQHPSDCFKAKVLLAGSWYEGFGSEIHVLDMGLAIAMTTMYKPVVFYYKTLADCPSCSIAL